MSKVRAEHERPLLLAVVGPTACGKSALGIALARLFDGEVVSCDSTAVYRGFDIGTDKVPPSQRRGIPHHLIDIVDPRDSYSAARFATDAADAIRAITARGKLPILVGGSGLYYRAVTRGLFPGPGRDERFRARLRRVARRRGVETLHRMVSQIDPESAVRIQPRDEKRLVRALEVHHATGRTLTEHFVETRSPISDYEVVTFALTLPAELLADRIAARVEQQFAQGLLDEIRSLRAAGVPDTAQPFGGLVYRQALEHLRGERGEAETRGLIKQENRRYARRQLIWFRKEPNVRWLRLAGERQDALDAVGAALRRSPHPAPSSQPSRPIDPSRMQSAPMCKSLSSSRAVALSRVLLIVLDSVGIGALPDAAVYGDEGSDTLGHVAACCELQLPTLRTLGLGALTPLGATGPVGPALAAFGRMREVSPGKDSVTGHWEITGVVLDRAFPLFPRGFPADALAAFEHRIGRGTLGNRAASGTQIIQELGELHVQTGQPIVYTSADSVFQIAAHEAVVPVPQLYRWCEIAYEIMCDGLGVGRVIARPFVGDRPPYRRTASRRDFARPPSGETLLDLLTGAGIPVVTLGKIDDLFAGRGIGRTVHGGSDDEVMDHLEEAMAETATGLLFANLVDFDTVYGHRNDPAGYASNLERFDARLSELMARLQPTDLLVITADHGNDPTTPSTDHSREYVPLLVYGAHTRGDVDLGTRGSFADVGQTIAELFGVGPLRHGASFLAAIAPAGGQAPAPAQPGADRHADPS